jgi:hypothetical protein
LPIEEKTVAADKNAVNEGGHENGAKGAHGAGYRLGKEKTGSVSQGVAERSGEFRMSTT